VVLSMCSSRGRPARCAEMVESFLATRRGPACLWVYVDEAEIDHYRDLMQTHNAADNGVMIVAGPYKTMIQVFNDFSKAPADYYHEVNDDHVFITPGWDLLLSAALRGRVGMAYPRLRHLPSSLMMSGELVRRLGYFAYPAFTHSFVDNFFVELGEAIGCMVEVPECIIEHRHWSFGMAPMDAVYEHVVATQNSDANRAALKQWHSEKPEIVRRALNG